MLAENGRDLSFDDRLLLEGLCCPVVFVPKLQKTSCSNPLVLEQDLEDGKVCKNFR